MSVLKYFKNIPRSPPIERQALSVIFFFKFAMRSLEKKVPRKKRACRPPTGDRPLSPLGWTTGPCRPWGGRQAPFFLPGTSLRI